ncbi:MAG: RNase adaptor protein RapZ [Gallionellales bacterium RIFCSPLOWO2_12_FULL_59_22]|nr:MAG: RNase adaptor protein RapZ [Gallionellales bacterium RIFCSPLOWO2_02_FULL_59_110]OGT02304.1 MAG: RNase adaptor protein RapZ [Gallionellales bacterium RIFCSPLOWO2_02_58_13]OGT14145.1 MAG: RNase adaptor protein RapZ [Gallionellales bacterium RIFCSPLOWO2_12_FULL_59_22]
MQLFLISGLSGSGKSVALKTLEDAGFYCVDNLPAELLSSLVEQLLPAGFRNIAVSVDVRNARSVQVLPSLLQLMQNKMAVRVLFLDAQTETLVKRFSETRRLHPLNDGVRTLPECVAYERELLAEISSIGHHIDTTELNANALRAWIKQFINLDRARLTLLFESFGFKHGIPLDADLVFDVRCLPNPHYNENLRPLTGRDAAVIEFLENTSAAQDMFGDIRNFVERWLPCYIADNRSYLTVAVGCTGGQHRSVYFAEKLARHFENQQQVLVRHRELA